MSVGIPDIDPPDDMTESGKQLWQALRAFGKGNASPMQGLLTRRRMFTPDGVFEEELKDGHPVPGTRVKVAD